MTHRVADHDLKSEYNLILEAVLKYSYSGFYIPDRQNAYTAKNHLVICYLHTGIPRVVMSAIHNIQMKNKFKLFTPAIALLIGSSGSAMSQEKGIRGDVPETQPNNFLVLKPFDETTGETENADVSNFISVSVKSEKRQRLNDSGLKFQVEISNSGERSIDSWYLLDSITTFVAIKESKYTGLFAFRLPIVDSRMSNVGLLARAAEKPKELAIPFKIISVKIDDRELSKQEFSSAKIVLPAKSRFSIVLGITDVLLPVLRSPSSQDKNGKWDYKQIALPVGIYQIRR